MGAATLEPAAERRVGVLNLIAVRRRVLEESRQPWSS